MAFVFYLYLLRWFSWLVADHCLAGVQRRIHIVNHIFPVVSDVALRYFEGCFAGRDGGLLAVAEVAPLLQEVDQRHEVLGDCNFEPPRIGQHLFIS